MPLLFFQYKEHIKGLAKPDWQSLTSLVNQTAFSAQGVMAYSISSHAKRVWHTFNTFLVSAAYPHPGVLISVVLICIKSSKFIAIIRLNYEQNI